MKEGEGQPEPVLFQPWLELLPQDSGSSQSRKAGTMGSQRQRGAGFRSRVGPAVGDCGSEAPAQETDKINH